MTDDSDEGSDDHGDRHRPTRRVREEERGHLVDTRLSREETVALVDLPGASADDLTVGIDRGSGDLVIELDDDALDRVDLPWASVEATKVWFNNGVLEVRLQRAGSRRSGLS